MPPSYESLHAAWAEYEVWKAEVGTEEAAVAALIIPEAALITLEAAEKKKKNAHVAAATRRRMHIYKRKIRRGRRRRRRMVAAPKPQFINVVAHFTILFYQGMYVCYRVFCLHISLFKLNMQYYKLYYMTSLSIIYIYIYIYIY